MVGLVAGFSGGNFGSDCARPGFARLYEDFGEVGLTGCGNPFSSCAAGRIRRAAAPRLEASMGTNNVVTAEPCEDMFAAVQWKQKRNKTEKLNLCI